MPYTPKQLAALKRAADRAYSIIERAIAHDPDLDKANDAGFSDYISRAQGALLDLSSMMAEREGK